MLLDDLAGDGTDILVADAGVIRSLRGGETLFREAERTTVLVEEIFLLEAEPCIIVFRTVARLLDGCGVMPSGIMTSHITRAPFLRAGSG